MMNKLFFIPVVLMLALIAYAFAKVSDVIWAAQHMSQQTFEEILK